MKKFVVLFGFVLAASGCETSGGGGGTGGTGGTDGMAVCPPTTERFPMVNEDQLAAEADARALRDAEEVQDQTQASLDLMLASPFGMVPENEADAPMYAGEQATSMSLHSSVRDPYRPVVLWGSWIGARTGLDNPDTIYRQVAVAEDAAYEITGKRNLSSGLFFQLMDSWPGTDGTAGMTLGFLDDADLVVDDDGSFTVTLDAEPANGRPNHIQLPPGSHSLLIRDTLSDWCQTPSELQVERTSPGDDEIPPPPTEDDLVDLTATNLAAITLTWLDFSERIHILPANTLLPADSTPGGLPSQYFSAGNFSLGPDDAIIVTLDPAGARYLGFQLGSSYFASFDYDNHTSSLSVGQAEPNADGTITYVLSLRDPGVWNWLDPVGHPSGLMFIRWQGAPARPEAAPIVQIVNIDDLAAELPPETEFISSDDRERQISLRRSRVALRRAD